MSRGSTPRHAQTAGDLGFAVKTKNVQMNYWGYKYRGMFKIKMIHVSRYPMLKNGGGVNIALCEPGNTILVTGRLI